MASINKARPLKCCGLHTHSKLCPFQDHCHPQTQGKIERWHQTFKNRILLENHFQQESPEAAIDEFVGYYYRRRLLLFTGGDFRKIDIQIFILLRVLIELSVTADRIRKFQRTFGTSVLAQPPECSLLSLRNCLSYEPSSLFGQLFSLFIVLGKSAATY